MSSRRISAADTQLRDVLSRFVPEEHLNDVVEAIAEVAEARAEEQSDQDHDRGDWHRWD